MGHRSQPWKLLGAAGQKEDAGKDLIIMHWSYLDVMEKLFQQRSNEIAAVITGFRMALGGAQEYYQVTPDLAVFGKAIAAGYSLSMICGRREIMDCGVHPSGTFNATPIAVAASLATIQELSQPDIYAHFARLGERLTSGITSIGEKYDIPVFAASHGAICQMQIGVKRSVEDFRDCLAHVDKEKYGQLFLQCNAYGVRIASARGRLYLSTAHTEEEIDRTLQVFDHIFSTFSG